jgi:hypothetical protein
MRRTFTRFMHSAKLRPNIHSYTIPSRCHESVEWNWINIQGRIGCEPLHISMKFRKAWESQMVLDGDDELDNDSTASSAT